MCLATADCQYQTSLQHHSMQPCLPRRQRPGGKWPFYEQVLGFIVITEESDLECSRGAKEACHSSLILRDGTAAPICARIGMHVLVEDDLYAALNHFTALRSGELGRGSPSGLNPRCNRPVDQHYTTVLSSQASGARQIADRRARLPFAINRYPYSRCSFSDSQGDNPKQRAY